jgi:ABC-type antimicrobial peptide transport system permease subunit
MPEPFMKAVTSGSYFVVRAAGDPRAIAPDLRRAVAEAGNEQPVYNVRGMREIVTSSLAGRRFSMLLLGILAALALVLAAVGIYGVISYAAAQRTHEIGIRMALGAKPEHVLRVVVVQSMTPVLGGVGVGLALSFALTRLMAHMLYGVNASDHRSARPRWCYARWLSALPLSPRAAPRASTQSPPCGTSKSTMVRSVPWDGVRIASEIKSRARSC